MNVLVKALKIITKFGTEYLQCYGFRGEALNALCRVAEVTVTTKTDEDDYAMAYTMNKNGQVAFMKPSHLGKGTIVTANHLFLNIPVRRKQLHIPRRASEELRKVEVDGEKSGSYPPWSEGVPGA
ncbi:unnamed protein product [Timema podura]|uniref:Uncharacterized protein n=1 Tax=Timema podura TaxID=61482 RepID=A0ABN7NKY5_TIMPD|nr:unnamed protein product [Timema podura]